MSVRSLETRLAKLEGARRPDNSRFLIWYRGDPAIAFADARHLFPDRSDAIMAEWLRDEPLPANRWVKDMKADLSAIERDHLLDQLQEHAKPATAAERASWSAQQQAKIGEMTDTELWFEILKVQHEPRIH